MTVPGCCAAGTGTKVMRSAKEVGGLHNLNMLGTKSLSYLTRSDEPRAISVARKKISNNF